MFINLLDLKNWHLAGSNDAVWGVLKGALDPHLAIWGKKKKVFINNTLSIRAYSNTGPLHFHDFIEVVLPKDSAP